MAKMKSVDMPQEGAIMAPFRNEPTTKDTVFIVSRLQTKLMVMGQEQSVVDEKAGVAGFMVVYTDYEKALAFANGDPGLIMVGRQSS